MSGEIQADVGCAFASARKHVEDTINKRIASVDYGSGVVKLALLPIIRKLASPDYPEIKKYTRRDKTAEFQLKIDHSEFAAASPIEQRALIVRALTRACSMIPELGVKDLDQKALLADLGRIALEHGWM